VQHSDVTTRTVKTRTTKSFRVGWSPLWSSDSLTRPKWADCVPTLRATSNWHERMPVAGTATAVGPRHVVVERCRPGEEAPGCRRPCGRVHRVTFQLIHGLTIDHVAELFPSGGLVPQQWKPGFVYLTTPDDIARYNEITGRDGAWNPGGKCERVKSDASRGTKPTCTSPKHVPGQSGMPTLGGCLCAQPSRSGYVYCLLHGWSKTTPEVAY